jgi:hypothetical protein
MVLRVPYIARLMTSKDAFSWDDLASAIAPIRLRAFSTSSRWALGARYHLPLSDGPWDPSPLRLALSSGSANFHVHCILAIATVARELTVECAFWRHPD